MGFVVAGFLLMPQFRYTARKSDGQMAQGVVEANDRASAVLMVEQQRCFPIKIELVNGAPAGAAKSAPRKAPAGKTAPAGKGSPAEKAKVSPAKVIHSTPKAAQTLSLSNQFLFTEQLGHLLSAGMTLDEALEIMVRRLRQPGLQELCQTLYQGLVDGQSLSQAMRQFPKVFSPLYVNMVSAGEVSGALPTIMKRLVGYLADVKALRDRVQQALIYPAVLVVVGFALIIVFMTVMVPQLTGFFSQTGQTLPTPTRILLGANYVITYYWWVAVLGVMAVMAIFKMLTRDPAGRQAWDRFRWKIPGYGHIMRYRFYAQFARTLGMQRTIDSGVSAVEGAQVAFKFVNQFLVGQGGRVDPACKGQSAAQAHVQTCRRIHEQITVAAVEFEARFRFPIGERQAVHQLPVIPRLPRCHRPGRVFSESGTTRGDTCGQGDDRKGPGRNARRWRRVRR